jgi:hypothetical protein
VLPEAQTQHLPPVKIAWQIHRSLEAVKQDFSPTHTCVKHAAKHNPAPLQLPHTPHRAWTQRCTDTGTASKMSVVRAQYARLCGVTTARQHPKPRLLHSTAAQQHAQPRQTNLAPARKPQQQQLHTNTTAPTLHTALPWAVLHALSTKTSKQPSKQAGTTRCALQPWPSAQSPYTS